MRKRLHCVKLIEKLLALPADKQACVFDCVECLADRFGHVPKPDIAEWTEEEFLELSMQEALRGMEEEPAWYTNSDIKERWS
jgi:hypothetical protein